MSATEKQLAALNDAAEEKAKRIAKERQRAAREELREELAADHRSASERQVGLLASGAARDEPHRRRFGIGGSGSTTTPD